MIQGPPTGSSLSRRLAAERRHIALALGFLTRLPFGSIGTKEEMGQAFCWLPLVGLVLGLAAVFPFAVLPLFSSSPLAQAWIYALFLLWLTRTLHMDGFSDVLDALGSGKTGAEFHRIMKDSRTGAFGATGIALAVGGVVCLASSLLSRGNIGPLVLAPVVARCLPLFFALGTPPHPEASLGRLFTLVPPKKALLVAVLSSLSAGLLLAGPARTLLALALCAVLLFFARQNAKRHGGYNGDFLGFLITGGELCVLTACLALG